MIEFGAQGRTQTFNLWFVGPALRQVELLGQKIVVGVGIEPTFRAFQTRANPSQLSDHEEGDEFLTLSAFARYVLYP
jgi:hypothetical protein